MTTPIYAPEVFEPFDDLLERKDRLSFMQNIPDMQQYAQAWADLAADFEACGLLSNAEYCKARATHYTQFSGEFMRVVDGPLAELIEC